MDDTEIESQFRPYRYDRWSILGLGFNVMSDFFDGAASVLTTASIMVVQHRMQMDVDKRFKGVMSGS